MKKHLLLVLILVMKLKAQERFDKRVKFFDTYRQSVFHYYAIPKLPVDRAFDGIIMGFEKISDKLIADTCARLHMKHEQLIYGLDYQKYWQEKFNSSLSTKKVRRYKQIAKWNKTILQQRKTMILTHWLSSQQGKYDVNYNIYNQEIKKDSNYNLYQSTKAQLDQIIELAKQKIKAGQYTHILLMCTGWNNHQLESVERYNEWLSVTRKAAQEEGKEFRPFYLGITWPSYWHNRSFDKTLIDLPNKANDADDLGLTHINYLIWKGLVPLSKENKLPLILIGHSFGARILSRASASSIYFPGCDTTIKIKLMIAFQGAYSVDRHMPKSIRSRIWRKTTGAGLYLESEPWNYFCATSSSNDKAINTLNGSRIGHFIGGSKAWQYTITHSGSSAFKHALTNSKGKINLEQGLAGRLYLDASNVVVEGHGDVSNESCGRLIWQLIDAACNK